MQMLPPRYVPGDDDHTRSVVAKTRAFLTDLRMEGALEAMGGDPERIAELGIGGALEDAIRPLLPGDGDAGYTERMEAGWTSAEAQTIQRWIGKGLQIVIALPVSTTARLNLLDEAVALADEWQVHGN